MAITTLNIKVTPRRMLILSEAAIYIGSSAKNFPHGLIRPVDICGKQRYDMHDLDEYLDKKKTGMLDGDDDVLGRLE